MMRKIISMANQKGGVGKTTTAINLSASLAAAEKRTLMIDCDSQGNATNGMGIHGEAIREKNLYHCLIGNLPLREVIVGTQIPHLDLVPANQDLVGIEVEFISLEDREKRLRNLIRSLETTYTVRLVKNRLNPTLTLGGILLTMYDTRNLLSRRVSEDVRGHFGDLVFRTVIPRNVRLSESPSHGLPIILYDIRSRGAVSYMELAKEILSNGRI
jgi:chromosome partitioning protein